jgi:hypothetical protein
MSRGQTRPHTAVSLVVLACCLQQGVVVNELNEMVECQGFSFLMMKNEIQLHIEFAFSRVFLPSACRFEENPKIKSSIGLSNIGFGWRSKFQLD